MASLDPHRPLTYRLEANNSSQEIVTPLVTIFEAGGSDMKNSLTDLDVKPIQNALWGLPKVYPPMIVVQFGSLPQYSMEITEALDKPLKEVYKRSNRFDATV
ncbi:hypothetical protein BGX38DRAFT_1275151 [Terfezia claveryi]|nr:hypothetical protein BGX38DRAFT_1275151 [Terfezia claveryi]